MKFHDIVRTRSHFAVGCVSLSLLASAFRHSGHDEPHAHFGEFEEPHAVGESVFNVPSSMSAHATFYRLSW